MKVRVAIWISLMRVEDAYHAHIQQNETSAKYGNNFLRERNHLTGTYFKSIFFIFHVMVEEKYKTHACNLVTKKTSFDYYSFISFDHYDFIIGSHLYEDIDWNRFWSDGPVRPCLWYKTLLPNVLNLCINISICI